MPFHERQEGSLCAQHALNSLLQGSYFTAVDLADIARQLDLEERARMAEGGTDSKEYLTFMAAESNNYDDSGFFSSQVIERAIGAFSVELHSITSEAMQDAKANPSAQKAYICWLSSHWFTIRKIGSTWYNLDSMLTAPALVGDTYLGLLLKELLDQNYSVFVAVGDLPDAMAGSMVSPTPSGAGEDAELQAALAASMMDIESSEGTNPGDGAAGGGASLGQFSGAGKVLGSADAPIYVDASGEAAELAAAIALSMQGQGNRDADADAAAAATAVEAPEAVMGVVAGGANPDKEELRRRRLLRFEQKQAKPP